MLYTVRARQVEYFDFFLSFDIPWPTDSSKLGLGIFHLDVLIDPRVPRYYTLRELFVLLLIVI